MRIPFNKPYHTGKELDYIGEAMSSGKIAGNNDFTQRCHRFFQERYGFKKVLLTTSCTDALEMAALLIDIKQGDEVIMPSYTFVSTSNAFVLRGAKIVFADSQPNHPNIDAKQIEALITPKTKAIVVVHYAGEACEMDLIMDIAERHQLFVIEDAAQAMEAFYKGKPLGGIGHLGAFSFHETKNIISGEGGLLIINDERFFKRSEIIWEKGTNRSAFFRGEVDKYEWIDIGSSFLPSDMIAAFLWAQLEQLENIQQKRKEIWQLYYHYLKPLAEKGFFQLCETPDYIANNAHLFFILCRSFEEQKKLREFLRLKDIQAVFHYLALHKSAFYEKKYDGRALPNCDRFTKCLLRLPFFYELEEAAIEYVCKSIKTFYKSYE